MYVDIIKGGDGSSRAKATMASPDNMGAAAGAVGGMLL
jgi:hypothetical protein